MMAVIEHQARVLDPRTLPDYLRELDRYKQATDFRIHGTGLKYSDVAPLNYEVTRPIKGVSKQLFLPEGPNPDGLASVYPELVTLEEFNYIKSGAAVGMVLYPYALNLLERLNIREIYDLKDSSTHHEIRGQISTLTDLMNYVDLVCHMPISFYAILKPPLLLGTDAVDIEIQPLAIAVAEADEDGSWNYKNQNFRSVMISKSFDVPELAASGLRGLSSIFPDSVFAETLLLKGLPKDIANMYQKIADKIRDYWDYVYGLTTTKPDFNERMYRGMTSQASISLIGFLKPLIERLGIRPMSMFYHDERLNLTHNIPVDSLDEVAGLISQGYYDGTYIPVINAVFNGNNIIMEFPSWENGVSTPVAMQIRNGSEKGTLESILSEIRANSITQ